MLITSKLANQVFLWGAVLALVLAPGVGTAGDEDQLPEAVSNPNPTQRLIIPVKDQSPEKQLSDQLECYEWACDLMGWDPYLAYDGLVDKGYAVELPHKELEEGLICLASEGAEMGAIAGEILDEPQDGAEIGAAIALASGLIHSSYLNQLDNPQAQRAVDRYERNLKKWDRKFAGCLSRKGYRVPPK